MAGELNRDFCCGIFRDIRVERPTNGAGKIRVFFCASSQNYQGQHKFRIPKEIGMVCGFVRNAFGHFGSGNEYAMAVRVSKYLRIFNCKSWLVVRRNFRDYDAWRTIVEVFRGQNPPRKKCYRAFTGDYDSRHYWSFSDVWNRPNA